MNFVFNISSLEATVQMVRYRFGGHVVVAAQRRAASLEFECVAHCTVRLRLINRTAATASGLLEGPLAVLSRARPR